MIINLISCPRTISTALMYSFAQRKDMKVFDEPFYGVYLQNTQYNHPGKDEIIRTMPLLEDEVLTEIGTPQPGQHYFIKNMASHFVILTPEKFSAFRNVFLIRNPRQIITSYAKVIKIPSAQDVGIQRQAELYRWYAANASELPLVIDSNDILDNPTEHLQNLCQALKISFEENMLHWSAGEKVYDGIWAPYWYKHVHRSTCFERQPSSQDPLPDQFQSLYEESLNHYHYLYQYSLTNPNYATKI